MNCATNGTNLAKTVFPGIGRGKNKVGNIGDVYEKYKGKNGVLIYKKRDKKAEAAIAAAKAVAEAVFEIGPVADTWIKLQQAYMVETNKVGNCDQIGYVAPTAIQLGDREVYQAAERKAWQRWQTGGGGCRGVFCADYS